MKPDRTTYEAWLLDRLEGNLSPEQERELDAFLAANPDLQAGADALPTVDAGDSSIDWKNELKKSFPPTGEPDATRLHDFLVAREEKELSPAQEKALDRFIYEHPAAERDARLMHASKVPAEPTTFAAKDTLAKHFPPQGLPDAHRLLDFLIAEREGDLTTEQAKALQRYMAQHPHAQQMRKQVAAARVAAEVVVYPNKQALKKKEVRVIALWQRLAVAASVALLLGFGWWLMRDGGNGPKVAVHPKTTAPAPSTAQQTVPANVPHTAPGTPTEARTNAPDGTVGQPGPAGSAVEGSQRTAPATNPPQQAVPSQRPMPQERTPVQHEPSEEEPQLAQQPKPEPTAPQPAPVVEEQNPALAQAPEPTPQAPARPTAAGQATPTLPALLANTVRSGMLDAPQRNNALDGDDAVAALDKGLRAVSGGDANLKVQRTGTRERVRLRLGHGLTVSASRGR